MRLLLDTHVFIWSITAPEKISTPAANAFTAQSNEIFISVVSLWEIVTKQQIGKLRLGSTLQYAITEQAEINGVQILGLEVRHLLALETMPLHHRDPFDRALIAQAMADNLTLVSRDTVFAQYPVPILW